MAYHTADYDVYVFLGDPASQPLWHWNAWQKLLPELDSLIGEARGKTGVRSTQNLPNRGGTVKFGRIGWNERDQQKWTHGSPINLAVSATWNFLSAEVWAPIWTQCKSQPPDVFLSIFSESALAATPSFNPVVLLAVVSTVAERDPKRVGDVVGRLTEVLSPRLSVFQRRPWGRAFGKIGFSNSIQDLHVCGLFKPGRVHERPVDLQLFADEWQSLPSLQTTP